MTASTNNAHKTIHQDRVTNGGKERWRSILPNWIRFASQPKPRLDNPDRHRNESASLKVLVQALVVANEVNHNTFHTENVSLHDHHE